MRYLRFKHWLTEMKQCADGIDAVFMEEVRRHAGWMRRTPMVASSHTHRMVRTSQHPYQGVPVGTIKKHATGKGNASKDEMIASVRELGHALLTITKPMRWHCCIGRWNMEVQDENPTTTLPLSAWSSATPGD